MSNEIDRATARPWKTLLCQSGWHVVDADNRFVAAMTDGTGQVGATDESRAALIVRAVNAHDALVEACEAASAIMSHAPGCLGDPLPCAACKCIDQLDAALALARGN